MHMPQGWLILLIVVFDNMSDTLLYRAPYNRARDHDVLHTHADGLEDRDVAIVPNVLDHIASRYPT